jgi:7-dehydrocholesterol reductase
MEELYRQGRSGSKAPINGPPAFIRDGAGPSTILHRFGDVRGGWVRHVVIPIVVMVTSPALVVLLWLTMVELDGSLIELVREPGRALAAWPWPTWTALTMLATWVAVQAALLLFLPGARHLGPVTPMGNRPAYKLNAIAAYVVTHALFLICAYPLRLFSPTIVYDHFGELLVTSSALAFIGCLLLYIKGVLAPSSTDAGSSDHPIWDFFWGIELHPSLGELNLKQLVNCRVAMMGWSIILVSFAAKQQELRGSLSWGMIASVGLGLVYIFKFFLGEREYFATLDIMHDRFGFYIAWGILAWLPGVYTLAPLYLVGHPDTMSAGGAIALIIIGMLALALSTVADYERHRVRARPSTAKVWGRRPIVIEAPYRTGDGREHTNLLLASGFWGVARHFPYATEIAVAVCWTVPCGLSRLSPWLYPIFLAGLLIHRSERDELRCSGKYGTAWREYCRRVPWRIIPGVY